MSDNAFDQKAQAIPEEQAAALPTGGKRLKDVFLEKASPASAVNVSYRMRVLSAIAISFVVLGHINFTGSMEVTLTEPVTFQGWFPYYSFHLPLFLFISGYFFRDLPEDGTFFPALLRFIGKKAVKLLVPYYLFSGLSLLFNTWIHTRGFTFGDSFSLTGWLVSPWTEPYFVSFATPAWYLPALFLAEVCLLLLRTVCRWIVKRGLPREILLLALTLGAGVAAVYCKATASPSGTAVVYLRSVVMLFFMQAGALYRRHLEKHDTLKSPWYFLIVFIAQFLLIVLSSNSSLSPGLYELKGLGKTGCVYFIGGLTGLMLWLRVSTILASLPRQSNLLTFIGKNTKYIMGLHVFSWFLFNTLLNFLYTCNRRMTLVSGFSTRWYHGFLYYCHTENPRMILLYYIVGMALPLLVAWLVQSLFRCLRRVVRR